MKKENNIISLREARLIALESQGLLQSGFTNGKESVLKSIEHLGYLQIDTLSVVSRAHHHILWSRLGDYQEKYLNELLDKDKSIFEYWSHAASYLPMKDYRFSLLRKKSYAEGKSHWFELDKNMVNYVMNRIKTEGPLQSKDFEHKNEKPGGWYEWKPAKKALEQLFMEGKLMVAKRQGFQKVYDLAENVLPADTDTSIPTPEEYAEYLIKSSIQSHGLVNENEVAYLRNSKLKAIVKSSIKNMLDNGELIEVKIAGLENINFITTKEKLKSVKKLKVNNTIHLLSPFDNLIIQRKRLQNIFNFDYTIECYVPEPKRKFGYFCLPVLYNDRFVARFDPKADRKNKIFYIKSMYFENDFKPDEEFNQIFVAKLKEFAAFNGCTKIVIENADKDWKKSIEQLI